MGYDGSSAVAPPQGHSATPDWYGGTTSASGHNPLAMRSGKGFFMRGGRKRMNVYPLAINLFLPWLLFAIVSAMMIFVVRFEHPLWTGLVVLLALLGVLFAGFMAQQQRNPTDREPSWLCFLFLTLLLAWVLAVLVGEAVFESSAKPYYMMQNLNTYTDVYTNRLRGQQIMDAGVVTFASGTYLDIKKSMGFKSNGLYCVAPIAYGNATLPTYDFWAVGKDCCSGYMPDFHCQGFNDPHARGGLRLMSGDDRPYYRLAVQQAEATYNIRSVHPLFFQWVADPVSTSESWMGASTRDYVMGVVAFFLLQLFFVVVAAIAFSKLGSP